MMQWGRVLTLTFAHDQPDKLYYHLLFEVDPIVPPSCSTSLSLTSIYDSGQSPTDDLPNSLSVAIPTPAETPSVMIAVLMLVEQYTEVGDSIVVDAPWTVIANHSPTSSYDHTAAAVAYLVTPGGASVGFDAAWSMWHGSFWEVFGFRLLTAATAPVQFKEIAAGATVTLDAAPTPGNILMAVNNNNGPTPVPAPPTGFTQVMSATVADSGIVVSVRCVQEGDDAEISLGGGVGSDFLGVSEWAIA